MSEFRWKLAREGGESLYLGEVCVGSVQWDGLRPKNDPNCYRPYCRLPGKHVLTNRPTMEEAKKLVERAVNVWLKQAGLV